MKDANEKRYVQDLKLQLNIPRQTGIASLNEFSLVENFLNEAHRVEEDFVSTPCTHIGRK